MADQPKARGKERFTMLEPAAVLNPSPEELATRIVEPLINFKERFTVLEPAAVLNPSPEELATRIVEPLINVGPADPVPQAARASFEQFAAVLQSLSGDERAAVARYAIAELKRLAG